MADNVGPKTGANGPGSGPAPAAPPREPSSGNRWLAVGVMVVGLLGEVGLLVGTTYLINSNKSPQWINLPILVVIGVVSLLACLFLAALALAMLNLADPKQALALPKGSVRAAIALSLVVVFAVVAVYFFIVLNANNTAASDFAKQVLTTLGTLLTSMTGFYFGSRTASSAHDDAQTAGNGGGQTSNGGNLAKQQPAGGGQQQQPGGGQQQQAASGGQQQADGGDPAQPVTT
jgi:hypothetical protein